MRFLIFLCSILILHSTAYALDCENDQEISQVLKQAQLKFEPASLRSCKTHPENQTQTIIAYVDSDLAESDEVGDYQLIFFTIDHENLKFIDTYKVPNKLRSDAIELESIHLDLAPYRVKSNLSAVGLRLDYSGRSSANPYHAQVLNLYDLKNKSHLLESLIVKEFVGETDTRCNAEIKEQSSTLHMLLTQSNGSFDIQVKNYIEQYEMQGNIENCQEIKRKKSNRQFVLKFNGQHYALPKKFQDDYVYD